MAKYQVEYGGRTYGLKDAAAAAKIEVDIRDGLSNGATMAFVGIETTDGPVRLFISASTSVAITGGGPGNPTAVYSWDSPPAVRPISDSDT